MNKKEKDSTLSAKAALESLTFQTLWGARQKMSVTTDIETRIKEELRIFQNLGLTQDMLSLKAAFTDLNETLGIAPAPTIGTLAGSYVAYGLGLM